MDALDKVSVEEIFPYDEMRPSQSEGVETVYDTCEDGGFVLLEGACGTGKTLLSLAPLLCLLNEKDDFERIIVATSVKQQQKPIEEEIRRINENSVNNYTAVSLVGKADMCPLVKGGAIERHNIYDKCDELRESTFGISQKTNKNYSDLIASAEDKNANKYELGEQSEDSKFSKNRIPRDDVTQTQYCPFYAGSLERESDDSKDKTPFDNGIGLVDPDDILSESSKDGLCPYSAMSQMTAKADIIVCNYYHIFDSRTSKSMMRELIDDNTLLVMDEAHNLVNKTRELMRKRQSINSIRNTISEMETFLKLLSVDKNRVNQLLNGDNINSINKKYIENKLQDIELDFHSEKEKIKKMASSVNRAHKMKESSDIDSNELRGVIDIYKDLLEVIDRLIGKEEIEEYSQIPLRDPEEISKDKISTWIDIDPSKKQVFGSRDKILSATKEVLKSIHIDVLSSENVPDFSSSKTMRFWDSWDSEGNKEYFRSIQFRERYRRTGAEEYEWERNYKAYLTMDNCLPKTNISSIISDFAGGVLMSATLEPTDVFKKEIGLDESNIKIVEEKFGLSFPEDNRKSLSVDLPKYKYNNRGAAFKKGKPNMNRVRRKYLDSIKSFIKSVDGNTMIAMQSYSEADWLYKMIRDEMDISDNNIILDKSSTNRETEEKKQEFFAGGKKILVTGARGTLVEGIDYVGQKLRGIAVCGVPLTNINGPVPKAIRTSYEDEFGKSNGFDYAFTIPAVRKTRQTIGRLIRSESDYGVRALIDERYCDKENWDSVRKYLSEQEQEEFKDIRREQLPSEVKEFFKRF